MATRGTASSSSWQGGAPVGKARLQLAIARARERSRSPIKGRGKCKDKGNSSAATDHDMELDLLLQRMERGDNRIPDTLLHGTYVKHLDNIWTHGLVAGGVRGGRHDVHTVRHTNGMKDRSGVRHGSDAIIFIDGAALRNDQDAKIRLSLDDVFLVERKIPYIAQHAKYFQCRELGKAEISALMKLRGSWVKSALCRRLTSK